MTNTTTTVERYNKGIPPIRVWELNDNSTRFDYLLAAPSDEELVYYWWVWAGLTFIVSMFVLIVLLGLVTSKKARRHPFNVYLIYLMIPDMMFSLLCSITCLTNAINGEYLSTWMCNFQSFYAVWGLSSNMWINTIIAYQVHRLLKDYHEQRLYIMPSRKTARNHALSVYLYTALLGCLGMMDGPFHSAPMSGLACLPVEIDIISSVCFWVVFFPAFAGIPVAYQLYVCYDVWKRKLIPEPGKVRSLVVYFGRIIFLFIAVWVPYLLLLFVLTTWVPHWAHFVGGTLTHLQGVLSAIISLGKPDIRCATVQFVRCRCSVINKDNNSKEDLDDLSSNEITFENYTAQESLLPESSSTAASSTPHWWDTVFTRATARNYNNNNSRRKNNQAEWNNWALPGPRIVHPVNTGSKLWPNKDGNYGDESSNETQWEDYDPSANTKMLIKWNAQQLLHIIQKIVARRNAITKRRHNKQQHSHTPFARDTDDSFHMPLDEVAEIIALPEFDKKAARRQQDPTLVEISPKVADQLQSYISSIAKLYRPNSFHNFDHASHVVTSVIKLMSRIVAPDNRFEQSSNTTSKVSKELHDHTYGITSDPLTQFACAFSALIHDVDHSGVPNARLIEENEELGAVYKNRSVAEQNSFDIAWNLLMGDEYLDLRTTLCATPTELSRFRQIVINSVMATDLADKELKELRNSRWEKAFKINSLDDMFGSCPSGDDYHDTVNRKATIVIEHLIQTADVSHTMQHWHVYRKWNAKLFMEMYGAYYSGRADKNPADTWYQGEIGFFDFYIIPLAKKMKDCGVFGISSDEYLHYATLNRNEWEARGKEVVEEMVEIATKKFARKVDPVVEQSEDSFMDATIISLDNRYSLSTHDDNDVEW